MALIHEEQLSWLMRFVVCILKAGPIPQHIAFIMDGNRRFAKKNSIPRNRGHLLGIDKISEVLRWCEDLGVHEITLYACSIENFKRAPEEVDGLMELGRQKFSKLLMEGERLKKQGMCIRVFGNLDLLPKDLQLTLLKIAEMTKNHNKFFLNLCVSYTAREEICSAMREAVEGVQLGLIRQTDISENLLQQCLYTNNSSNPDLLVRTSGEVRLSNFLLWQCTFSVLSFVNVLWPEISFWNLCASLLHYQIHHKGVQETKQKNTTLCERLQNEQDYNCVMAEMQTERENSDDSTSTSLPTRLLQYAQERHKRIANFLQHVNAKRAQKIEDLCKQHTPAYS